MLWVALDSWNPAGFWKVNLGLPSLSYGQITTMVYLKVSISDFLTLFRCASRATWGGASGYIQPQGPYEAPIA
jgi:H+-transporting ATPase